LRLLLTGGTGFVGRHVVDLALRSGHSVEVLSRDPAAARAVLASLPGAAAHPAALRCRRADLQGPANLADALAGARPEAVVHLAGLIRGTPAELAALNVEATAALLAVLARHAPAARLVYVSSFAAEDAPSTPYSESKQAAEDRVRASPGPWVILRPTLIYGAGDTANTPALAASLRSGTHWLPGGGRARIQPVHVGDVAAACLAAAGEPRAAGRTYRLGGPEPLSVADFRAAVRDASGGRAVLRAIPLPLFALAARALALLGRRGALDVLAFHRADHAVDSAAARAELGFSPRPLAQGLHETFG